MKKRNLSPVCLNKRFMISLAVFACTFSSVYAQKVQKDEKFYTEKSPSVSEYFSWINTTNEGAHEDQILTNLKFFKWLHETYGMTLDIYSMETGAIDGASNTGYMGSPRYNSKHPSGMGVISDFAATMGTRLGTWGSPDGFGNTPEEEKRRMNTWISLSRDYNFKLFKLDAVCGQLRPEKYDTFDKMMTECRKYTPDLIVLNHRLDLGPGIKHATTFLWQGVETYIDIHMANWSHTAPHHRAGALQRGIPPELMRLTEDHGVCLSSCLDYWEDDMILQAFNRGLLLAPQIYGNPWLLRDDEFPKLAYIFNLHRKYRDILVNGILLPKEQYGSNAVSRGSDDTRFITLRNLSWEPVKYKVNLDSSIGLKSKGKVQVVLQHPYIKLLGEYQFGQTAEVEVLPFRSCLVKITGNDKDLLFKDKAYEIVQDVPGKPVKVKMLTMDEKDKNYHRELAPMEVLESTPSDYTAMYYATTFTADNNALECRSLDRSGQTRIPIVQEARNAFFKQKIFVERELWDEYLFDGDPKTSFSVRKQDHDRNRMLCLDLGESQHLDKLVISCNDEYSIYPLKTEENTRGYISNDLIHWETVNFLAGTTMEVDLSRFDQVRYFRFIPIRINEINGYANGKAVSREKWGASNLFMNPDPRKIVKSWKSEFTLDHISRGAYLCLAFNGVHGKDGAWAGMKIGDRYYGCPDKSTSFPSNTFAGGIINNDRNNTFYFPLTQDMVGKKIEIYGFALKTDDGKADPEKLDPRIYVTAYPIPFQEETVTINR